MSGCVQIIQGGQWGSEAKGTVAAHLALSEDVDYAVRTGATNAGHTVWYEGVRYVMQQLPVGWVNPNTQLVIGAGALVDVDILSAEIAIVSAATNTDITERLSIDPRAYLHQRSAAERSASSGRHYAIGATGKGCSEALRDRIANRGVINLTLGELPISRDLPMLDTEQLLNAAYDRGALIQLEGTQGTLLDIALGPYPYTTHKQTGPAQWMMEAGLSPGLRTDIVMVVRTFPIRVAGNSGPLPSETSWLEMIRTLNRERMLEGVEPLVREFAIEAWRRALEYAATQYKMPGADPTGALQHLWPAADRLEHREALSELNARAWRALNDDSRAELSKVIELTTVTKKPRRIAHWDSQTMQDAARQVRPDRVALTFFNYAHPAKWYVRDETLALEEEATVGRVHRDLGAPVVMLNRGPLPEHMVEV